MENGKILDGWAVFKKDILYFEEHVLILTHII